MTATTNTGVMKETRYIESYKVSSIENLTKALWDSVVVNRRNTDVNGKTKCVPNRYCVTGVKVAPAERFTNISSNLNTESYDVFGNYRN